MGDSAQLSQTSTHDEEVDTAEIVVDWSDDETVAGPYGTGGEQGRVLEKGISIRSSES